VTKVEIHEKAWGKSFGSENQHEDVKAGKEIPNNKSTRVFMSWKNM